MVCDRQITKRTPSEFYTQVIQYGVRPSIRSHYQHSALKQYRKDGRARRTELLINNPYDFGHQRGLAHFDALVALGYACNDRLLEPEQLSQDCFVSLDAVRHLQDLRGPLLTKLRRSGA